jgi:hypothetical protein
VKLAAPHATYQTKGVQRALSFHRHPPHHAREDAMSIIRLIHIKIDPSESENATRPHNFAVTLKRKVRRG